MSGRLRSRLGALEGRVHAQGACQACSGRSSFIVLMNDDEPCTNECSRCGRTFHVVRFTLASPPEGWISPGNPE